MQFQRKGKNALVFALIFLLIGLITGNFIFYIAGAVIACVVFFDLLGFLAAIDAMDVSILRKVNKEKLFLDNLLNVEVWLDVNAGNTGNIYFQDIIPGAFALISGDAAKKIMPGSSCISYSLRAVRHGRHLFSESYLLLDSDLGMFKHKMVLESRTEVNVYPPVLSRKSTIMQYVSGSFGSGRSSRRGMGTDVAEIRNYFPGDDFRHIDWKTSLRLNGIFTKEFEADTELPMFILLDHSKESNLELAVRIAGYLAQKTPGKNQPLGMITFTHDRITNRVLMKKGKKQFEILGNLFKLSPKEGKPCTVSMDTGEIKELGRKLRASAGSEFCSLLSPFFIDSSEHLRIMESQGIYQAVMHVINFSRSPSMIAVITDPVSDAPLMDSIRLATYYGNKVFLIVTSPVLFREYDVLELEEQYQEYMRSQEKIEKFKRLKGVKVVEIGPMDKPELLINQAVSKWKTRY